MSRRSLVVSFAVAAAFGFATAHRAAAQARAPAAPTTVQLPTFNFFGVSTTVDVPDGGEGFLGGVNSAASGNSERGIPGLGFRPFSNSAGSSTASGGSMSVRATIHDFDAMDRALLGKDFDMTRAPASSGSSPAVSKVLTTDVAGSLSMAEIRRQQSAEDAATNYEAQKLLDEGKAYDAAGKTGLAKIQYRMAAHHAVGKLKDEALADLQRLSIPPAPTPASDPPSP